MGENFVIKLENAINIQDFNTLWLAKIKRYNGNFNQTFELIYYVVRRESGKNEEHFLCI